MGHVKPQTRRCGQRTVAGDIVRTRAVQVRGTDAHKERHAQ